jgi:hypothetical protein
VAPASVKLSDRARDVLAHGFAASTSDTYSSGVRSFWQFAKTQGYALAAVLPAQEEAVLNWLVFAADGGLRYSTLRVYLAAVGGQHLVEGYGSWIADMARVKLLMRGIKRIQGKSPDKRRPISFDLLRRLAQVGPVPVDRSGRGLAHADTAMLWAAHTLGYFAFFRVGEFTAGKQGRTDGRRVRRPLQESDVVFSPSILQPNKMTVFLAGSKTDQFGQGESITVGASGQPVCAVSAMRNWILHPGRRHGGELFRFQDGVSLTRARLSAHLTGLLEAAGVARMGYKGHSYRIGATSDAVRAGLPSSVIMLMGRWRSLAFMSYPREQEDVMASIAQRLVAAYCGSV